MSKGFFTGPNIAAGAALTGAIVYFASRGNMYAHSTTRTREGDENTLTDQRRM